MFFHLGIPLSGIAIRTAIVYLVILLGLRLFGKTAARTDEHRRPRDDPADREVSGVQVAYLEPDGTISVIPIDAKVLRGTHRVKHVRQLRRNTG